MFENKIIWGDCSGLIPKLSDNSINLIITSPPYNVGKDYEMDLWKNDEEYLQFIFQVLRDLYRVLKPGRFICWNVSHCPHKNTPVFHAYYMEQIGYEFQDTIIWQKPDAISPRFGNTIRNPYPFSYFPNNIYEYVFIYQKPGPLEKKKNENLKFDLRWLKTIRNDIWKMNTVREHEEHPAAFPLKLPLRLVQLFSYPRELIFDPFCGTGTTLIAAKELNRRYLGIDIKKEYINIAQRNLNQEVFQLSKV